MNQRRFVSLAFALSLACLPLPADAQAAKTDPAISKHLKDFSAAISAKDAAKLASFYTEDATFNPPNEPMLRGRAAIQAWMQKMFDQGATTLTLTPVESAISGNIAYSVETFVFTMKPPTGTAMTDKGKAMVVYKQVGGKWLMAHDIFNSDLPPPPPPAKPAPVKK